MLVRMAEPAVVDNTEAHRFELNVDGKIAFLTYRLRPGRIVLLHTEVPPELEGRGIGGRLARAGLDFAREHRLKAAIYCPFIKSYLERHPEYSDLI